jgi:predicted hydrocarbon binding protein
MSALLNRQVLTASDKSTLYELKDLILDDSTSKEIQLAKARIVARANRRVFRDTLVKVFSRARGLVPDGLNARLLTETNKRRYFSSKKWVLSGYTRFSLWLKKPVTVSTVLACTTVWALAIAFTRFEFPWSEIGYTSGYGAVFLTAVMTARLTVNSPRLWLERPQRREPAKEMNRWILETALARRSLVLHEIEVFLASGSDGRVKEINLKANAFLMRKRDWQSLQDALYDTFLRGAPPLLFELGHRLGQSVGRDLMRLRGKPGTIIAQLEEVSRTLGWGIVSVHGDLARGSKLTFTIHESPFSVAESPMEGNTRACHMLCGIMGGIAEEVYGWPCSSFEQSCIRNGNDACKIVVTPATVPPAQRERWNLSVLFPALYPWTR